MKKNFKTLVLACSVLAISTSLLPSTNVFASESINTDISNISETNISSHEVDQVAQALESMFDNKVSTSNFKKYVNNNFSDSEIAIAESELESRISNSRPEFRVAWNEMGGCIAGKIRDEFFAMISVGTIVKYAQKKAWKELALVVLKFVKANGLKTNAIIVAGQLALWAIQCGLE